ncbi:hypothetical protein BDP27DRAFT_1427987 [Rhodocollybia butyracea]|uniref:Uncharacterized protein n=1 Tax=Rhodocollybia butyracea TaxID=206335 RepID=A0A9P5U0Z0_9AGAR|nr:hypothetical protein BDP27DRAFT_1427987 [Rhodocollybia butyracea]
MKKEWKVLLDECKNYVMKPVTVTFIDAHGVYKVTGENKLHDETRSMFTKAINEALHLQFPITFEGFYDPEHVESDLLWRYFELVGGDPRCTTVSPCLGFYTTECLAIVKPILGSNRGAQIPTALFQTDRFQALGTIPFPLPPDKGLKLANMMGKFENHFMKGHVWEQPKLLDMEAY